VIVCPRCGSELSQTKEFLACPSCPYRAGKEEAIIIFEPGIREDHEDYKSEGLDALYSHERQHPWFAHRVNVILKAFEEHASKDDDILEVGAGTGHTARALLEHGYRNLAIGEIHKNGLLYAQRYGLNKLYQFDLRSPPFREHFDVVALFDVLEHIEDDATALRNIHTMLRPGGRIILTVPAHRWLWSRIDDLSSHYRRYNRPGLTAVLERAGFEALECRYFFTAMVPGLLLRRLLTRNATWDNVESGCGLKVSRLSKLLIGLAGGPGDFLLSPLRRVVGGSLLAVARRK
jgi:SAM-dependent methyltransferase